MESALHKFVSSIREVLSDVGSDAKIENGTMLESIVETDSSVDLESLAIVNNQSGSNSEEGQHLSSEEETTEPLELDEQQSINSKLVSTTINQCGPDNTDTSLESHQSATNTTTNITTTNCTTSTTTNTTTSNSTTVVTPTGTSIAYMPYIDIVPVDTLSAVFYPAGVPLAGFHIPSEEETTKPLDLDVQQSINSELVITTNNQCGPDNTENSLESHHTATNTTTTNSTTYSTTNSTTNATTNSAFNTSTSTSTPVTAPTSTSISYEPYIDLVPVETLPVVSPPSSVPLVGFYTPSLDHSPSHGALQREKPSSPSLFNKSIVFLKRELDNLKYTLGK